MPQQPLDLQPLDLQPLDEQPLDLQPLDLQPLDEPGSQGLIDRIINDPVWQSKPASTERRKDTEERPDALMFRLSDEFYEKGRQNLIDQIAMSKYIPEGMKPNIATLADAIRRMGASGIEALGDPASVLGLAGSRVAAAPEELLNLFRRRPEVLPPWTSGRQLGAARSYGRPVSEGVLEELPVIDVKPTTPAQKPAIPLGPVPEPAIPRTPESGRFTDLDEVKEAQRLRDVHYTGHEQAGGTALDIVEDPTYLRGTELGTSEVSSAGTEAAEKVLRETKGGKLRKATITTETEPLPYPLNVVPEHVRPRSNQAVQQALSPRSFVDEVVPDAEPTIFESGWTPNQAPTSSQIKQLNKGGRAAQTTSEQILKSEPPISRADKLKALRANGVPITDLEIVTAEARARLTTDAIRRETKIDVGPTGEKIKALPMTEKEKGLISRTLQAFSEYPAPWRADQTNLYRQGQAGRTLWEKVKSFEHKARSYYATWTQDYEQFRHILTPNQLKLFGKYADGTLPIPPGDIRLKEAVMSWRAAHNVAGDAGMAAKLRMFFSGQRERWIPFIKHGENYWPRMPVTATRSQSYVDNLMEANPKLTRQQATWIEEQMEKNGEFITGSQYTRVPESNIEFRTDFDAGIEHLRRFAKRVAKHEILGPKDIAGRGTGLLGEEGVADLIEQTGRHKNEVFQIMRRAMDRNGFGDPMLMELLDWSRAYSTKAHLQTFFLPNILSGTSANVQKIRFGNLGPVMKELTQVLTSRGYRSELERAGIMANISHSMLEEVSRYGGPNIFRRWWNDPHFITPGEYWNRMMAGAVGKGVAKNAFNELKAELARGVPFNKLSKNAMFELRNYIPEDPATVLRQGGLTDNQLQLAAARMAEVTQGLNLSTNLPGALGGPVKNVKDLGFQLMAIFKKMAFQASKSTYDNLKPSNVGWTQATANLVKVLSISGIAGAGIKRAKAGMKAGASQLFGGDLDYQTELENRTKRIAANGFNRAIIDGFSNATGIDPLTIAEYLDDIYQGFAFGIPADLIQAASYNSVPEYILGPALGDIFAGGYNLMQAISGRPRGLAGQVLRSIPIPFLNVGLGDALPQRWFPPEEDEQREPIQ